MTWPGAVSARGGFPTTLATALGTVWPQRFIPMPNRSERVSVVIAHHALRAEIRARGEAAGGAVSKDDLGRWVDSVIVYTRAVQTLTALRAIREAGSAYHIHPGGVMERSNGTTAMISGRPATASAPRNQATREASGAKIRPALEAARRERCAGVLAKLRSVLTHDVLEEAIDDPVWDVLAATFALRACDLGARDWWSHYAYKRLHDRLAPLIAAHITACQTVRLEHARVLNLLDALTWISDPSHARDSWPRRGEEEMA